MMTGKKGNTNARKGEKNRVKYSARLPEKTIEDLRRLAAKHEVSQADLIIALVEGALQ